MLPKSRVIRNYTSKKALYRGSPADRGTKKHVYLPYRGAIPFWFYHIPLRLVSIFLNVVRVEISCGPLPTRFSTILCQGGHLNVLYLVFYELSVDASKLFFLKLNLKYHRF